jgi:hypothetical protein
MAVTSPLSSLLSQHMLCVLYNTETYLFVSCWYPLSLLVSSLETRLKLCNPTENSARTSVSNVLDSGTSVVVMIWRWNTTTTQQPRQRQQQWPWVTRTLLQTHCDVVVDVVDVADRSGFEKGTSSFQNRTDSGTGPIFGSLQCVGPLFKTGPIPQSVRF